MREDDLNVVIVTTKRALTEAVESAVERARVLPVARLRVDERAGGTKTWVTSAEGQAYLGLSRSTLVRYRKGGLLPFSRVGASVYYRVADIEELIARGAQRVGPA